MQVRPSQLLAVSTFVSIAMGSLACSDTSTSNAGLPVYHLADASPEGLTDSGLQADVVVVVVDAAPDAPALTDAGGADAAHADGGDAGPADAQLDAPLDAPNSG